MDRTTIGIIGCGKIAEKHLNAYKRLKDVDVVVSDIDSGKKKVARSYGAEWSDEPSDLIEGDRVDAIDICTPISSHIDICVDALDNDKHVFCEKPLTKNLDEALQIKQKVEHSDRVLMVGYLYRFHPAFEFGKEVIQNELIGDPYFAVFRVGGRGSHRSWKHKSAEGGGARNEMLVHMLDLIFWYFGEERASYDLYTQTILEEREIDGERVDATAEDLILLNMEMENDVRVICESDLITPSYMNYVEIHGENGSFWTSILDYFPTVLYCKESRGIYDKGKNIQNFSRVDLFEKELRYFINCIRNGEDPKYNSVDDSIRIRRIIESTLD